MCLLSATAHCSVRRISPDVATQRAIYRFLNNEKVEEQTLIDELCNRSASLCSQRHVLCIQDTTEMNLISHQYRIKENSGLGRVDDALHLSMGFKMHATLMVDADQGTLLGFSDLRLWHRPADMADRKERNYKSLPIEQKESYKWIEAARDSKERLITAAAITFIEDREGDIYEQLSSLGEAGSGVYYIIRSKSNRYSLEGARVWDQVEGAPVAGLYTIDLQTDHRKKRQKQQVRLQIRFSQVTLPRGPQNGSNYPRSVTLNIVDAWDGKEGGIRWRLFTTHQVTGFEDAVRVVEWYSQRWMIEQVHRLLKHKGFQLEDCELESGWAIRKMCILMLSALIRIIQMNMAYAAPEGGQSIDEVFNQKEIECLRKINSSVEGKTIKQQNQYHPNSLKWATWIIARLGGWSGYASAGPPGIILLKRGLDKFTNIFFGWTIAQDVYTR